MKRKRKRNPLKEDKKLMRKVAELLAKAIEKEPDGVKSYLLAAELIRRDSLYCEECHSYDIEKDCDWSICYPEIYDQAEDSTLESAKEAAEDLAEDLAIVDYVKVFRYTIQWIRYEEKDWNIKFKPSVNLSGMRLSGAELSGANLYGADLSRANLYGADLSRADLLYGADLSGANLSEANLSGANLSGAYLSRANLFGANLFGANLSGANLSGANLLVTNLSWVDLFEAIFTGTKIDKTTDFSDARNFKYAIDLIIPNPRRKNPNDKKKTKKKSIKRR